MKAIPKSLLTALAFGTVLAGSAFAQSRPLARGEVQVVRPQAVNPVRAITPARPVQVRPVGPVVRGVPPHNPQDRIEAARIKAARIKAAREAAAQGPNPRRRANGN